VALAERGVALAPLTALAPPPTQGSSEVIEDADQTQMRAQGYRPGVGVMLLDKTNRVFVGRRIDMRGENWQMPQGGIDKGETPIEAALRELKEEIGTDHAELLAESSRWLSYDVPPGMAGRLWGGRYRGQRQKWFAMRFSGRDGDIDVGTPHPEFDAWKWVAAAELPELIVAFKRQLYLDILAEFASLLG
jgi:putative (di)nucleoside polyphosphate hydrolase